MREEFRQEQERYKAWLKSLSDKHIEELYCVLITIPKEKPKG